MNEDQVPAVKYCISTSNRNFKGRQVPLREQFCKHFNRGSNTVSWNNNWRMVVA